MSDEVTVWFNPSCSKCRGAQGLLDEQGVACELVRYLDDTPSRGEIERVLALLRSDDPRTMMRKTSDEVRPLVILEMSSHSVTPKASRRPRVTASLFSCGIKTSSFGIGIE